MADHKHNLAVPRQEQHNPLKVANVAAKDDVERDGPNTAASWWGYLNEDVDTTQTTSQLALYCFMTGYIDVISFSAIFVWCGFQTGNFAQLAIALARLFYGPSGSRDTTFHRADQQALTSLISFNAGAFIGRIGDRVGAHKRIWLISGTFIQAVLTMAAAIAFWKSGQPSISNARDDPAWTNVATFVGLAFMSASLGVQGIVGKRLNTQFGTTIVLTTVWVELVSDPRLFRLRQRVITRDHRLIAAVSLFIGAFISRVILQKIGTAGTLGIGVGFRILSCFTWLFVPTKRGQERNTPPPTTAE
ncbi:hypothetical protein K443DRAFT_680027 [Laccaria amethystina LaAM-08-1]|uniref:DUF1275 domain protein n=1 Tax=Laccaria amethystina LaAM-08-1 TaxID=1095629 RepID=A0A0C9XCL6_9AGAR|nr:hypothetical protein K443DRAFT_680027 [Laccaria amethystina LaAM-08-1]